MPLRPTSVSSVGNGDRRLIGANHVVRSSRRHGVTCFDVLIEGHYTHASDAGWLAPTNVCQAIRCFGSSHREHGNHSTRRCGDYSVRTRVHRLKSYATTWQQRSRVHWCPALQSLSQLRNRLADRRRLAHLLRY